MERGRCDKTKAVQVILFDLDDTLFDFQTCFETGLKEAFRLHPFTQKFDAESLYQCFKHYSDSLWPLQTEGKVTFDEYRRMRIKKTLQDLNEEMDDQTIDEFNQLFNERYLDVMLPFPSVPGVLAGLTDQYRLGIVTNGAPDTAYRKIISLGFEPYFPKEKVFVSEEIGYAKPHPQIFETVLKRMGAHPDETLFIGDSWTADIAGAVNAGMRAVWLNYRKQKPSSDHRPFWEIDDLTELLPLLKKLIT